MGVWAIAARLAVAIVCSAAVGVERETAHKAAGLRTHTLVGVGSAIFSMLSIAGFEGPDESRIAAQIVTGIGFLGAGAIFRDGQMVQGLTTAAGLWSVAAVGMAAGSGSYVMALLATVAILIVLYSLRAVDEYVERRTRRVKERIEVTLEDAAGLSQLLKFVRRLDEAADQMNFRRSADGGGVLELAVEPEHVGMLCEMIAVHKGIKQVEQLSPLYWTHPPK